MKTDIAILDLVFSENIFLLFLVTTGAVLRANLCMELPHLIAIQDRRQRSR